jgi:hypothetical protein
MKGEFIYEIGGNYLPNSELSDELLNTGDKPLPDGVKIRITSPTWTFLLAFKFRTKEEWEYALLVGSTGVYVFIFDAWQSRY